MSQSNEINQLPATRWKLDCDIYIIQTSQATILPTISLSMAGTEGTTTLGCGVFLRGFPVKQLLGAYDPMSVENWMPRPWNAELRGCIWLPRMLDKGRQALESKRQGRDLMNSYLFGDFDYADAKLLKFLHTKDARVLELLCELDDDEAVATRLISESGRSADEIQAWGKRFRQFNTPFIAMWDADEGRRGPSLGTTLLKLFYNFVLMPPVYLGFWIADGLRQRNRG